MERFNVTRNVGGIEGLCVITPNLNRNNCSCFTETYNQKDMEAKGLDMVFVQENQSCSRKGVLRGMHLQIRYPQGKLVRVINGSVFVVAVDLRKDSKSFGKWYGIELNKDNKRQFYIPEGFAHGFLVTSEIAELCFKVTNYYYPEYEQGFAWNDPEIKIVWPGIRGIYKGTAASDGYYVNEEKLILAERDQNLNLLSLSKIKDGI